VGSFFLLFFVVLLTEPLSLSESQGNTVNTTVTFEIIQNFKTLNYINNIMAGLWLNPRLEARSDEKP
jgi:hypothetical protein